DIYKGRFQRGSLQHCRIETRRRAAGIGHSGKAREEQHNANMFCRQHAETPAEDASTARRTSSADDGVGAMELEEGGE
ncbi:MAG: hypothetical protein WCO86_15480, partial [Planctomycetota bacterium]